MEYVEYVGWWLVVESVFESVRQKRGFVRLVGGG